MIISRSIHVAANGIISFFLWLSNIPLYRHPTSSLSIHVSMGICYFRDLAIVTSAAMNIGMYIYFVLEFSPVVGLLDHMVTLFLVF